MSWTILDAGQPNQPTSLMLERELAGTNSWTTIATDLSPTVNGFTDTGLASFTDYQYRITATNACNFSVATISNPIRTQSISGCTGPPTPPIDLMSTTVSSTQVNLTWTDTASGANDEQAFTVERSADGGQTWRVLSATVLHNATSYSDTSAHAQTTYQYRVKATNECDDSDYTTPISATTFGGANDFAPEFDSGHYASAGEQLELRPGAAMTIEAWIRPTVLLNDKAIVSKRGSSGDYYELRATNDKVIFEIRGGAQVDSITSDAILTTDTWQHVSGGYDGDTLFVTVNDTYKEKGSTTVRPTAVTAWGTKIGRGGQSSQWSFIGRIDQVRLSNSMRYSASSELPPSRTYTTDDNTKAFWPLNEGTGLTANDATGGAANTFNNVMTLTTGTQWGAGVASTAASGTETVGIYSPGDGSFFLSNTNVTPIADAAFGYGPVGFGWIPVSGDWDGNGTDTIGLYDPSSGFFYLKNTNTFGGADITFGFGPGGLGWVPIAGDWDGDGIDTVGLYVPSAGYFYLRNENAPGAADVELGFGAPNAGWIPLAGDWDGNGTDTVGVYDPANGSFFLRNSNTSGVADVSFGFGAANGGFTPLAGDWDGNGIHTVGLYLPSFGVFLLRDDNAPGAADYTAFFGATNSTPLVGDWDGAGAVSKSRKNRKEARSHLRGDV